MESLLMTQYLSVDPLDPEPALLEVAATALREGGIVAFPTETVYGLGALAADERAAERLSMIKERPPDKPFSVLIADPEDLTKLVEGLPPHAQTLIERYWPGPLTLVLPVQPGSERTVGVRLPAAPIARHLVRLAGGPLLAPSANPSSRPPATTADEVRSYFDGRIDVVIDGGPATLMQASTVVRVDERGYEVLRTGIITPEMVHQQIAGRTILFVCTGNTCRSPMAVALFRKHLAGKVGKPAEDLEELGYRILSAGTSGMSGLPASRHAVEVMTERGCDLSRHLSRALTEDLLLQADRVYAMTHGHLETVSFLLSLSSSEASSTSELPYRGWRPASAPILALLSAEDILDPIGSDLDAYRACADQIETAVKHIIEGTA
jgi:tRNA threonylcarbamoyl adenosine modification protein (Sua5/YciO/YrdC/YwlC family)